MRQLLPLVLLLAACARAPIAVPPEVSFVSRAADPFIQQLTETRGFSRGQPVAVTPTPDGDAVLFLRSGPRSPVRDLYSYDVQTGTTRLLLTANDLLDGVAEALSAEEKARRERLRQAARGIASFGLSKDGEDVLIPLSGSLYHVSRRSGEVTELPSDGGYPIDPRFSPDGRQVAVVRDHDLWVIDVEAGTQTRLTTHDDPAHGWGTAEFVAQEEMNRMRGYWWSPDGSTLAVQWTDQSPVAVWHTTDPTQPGKPPQPWHYPAAGEANAEVRLALIRADGSGEPTWITWDHERYPYLASVKWPDQGPLTLLLQDRRQLEEVLLSVDDNGKSQVIHTETDPAWLNLDNSVPRWLDDGSGFLWSTERDGHWALELRDTTGALIRTLTTPTDGYRHLIDIVDGAAWFDGGPEPTESRLLRVPLAGGAVETLHGQRGQHSAHRNGESPIWVHRFEGIDTPASWTVMRGSESLGQLESVAESAPFAPRISFHTVGSRQMRAVVIRPRESPPGARYPVLLHVYAGPHAKRVHASSRHYLRDQWYADQGFVVVSIDGRGTPDRGRAWERAIRQDLITVPLEDQVAGLEALSTLLPDLDTTRVGVFGWSFGGYFSAHAVMQRPDIFLAGVAGAPVADWRDYDTHYTERYMGLPDENPDGYAHSSALTHAPDLERPLLILHGTDDDNVYFAHAVKLSDALFRAGKPHRFLPLTGYTHMVTDPAVASRLHEQIIGFLARSLSEQEAL